MTKQGIEATSVTVEDWRINSLNVNVLVDKTKVAMQDNKPTTVILAGLESSTYKAQDEEGNNIPIRKTIGRQYHVEGELVVCGKEAQIKLFKLLEPMWTLDSNTKLVVVCLFLHYIAGSCCDDPDHAPNRKLQNFESKIRSDL
jgi:hypothetical protein